MTSSDSDTFLSKFFGEANKLRWQAYADNSMPQNVRDYLQPWIEGFRSGTQPLILPRVNDGNSTTWYAFASDARDARSLREKLTAFVGPTYTSFHGQLAQLNAADDIDAVCQERFGAFVFKVDVPNSADKKVVSERLQLIQSLSGRVPQRATQVEKPIGRLIRDLDMALVIGNEESAWTLYESLRSRGRLSANNLAFLQVRIHAAFGQWKAIRNLPRYDDLLRVARPVGVTESLVRTVYELEFRSFEESLAIDEAVAAFQNKYAGFGTILHSRSALSHIDCLKAMLLKAVAAEVPQLSVVDEIADAINASLPEDAWASKLVEYAKGRTQPTPAETKQASEEENAKDAIERGDFDDALALLLQCTAETPVLRSCVEVAFEIGTIDAAQKTLTFFDEASETAKDEAAKRRSTRRNLDALRERVAETTGAETGTVHDWNGWFELLENDDNVGLAAQLIANTATDWSGEETLTNPESTQSLADQIIRTRPPATTQVVQNAVPKLMQAFIPGGQPVQAARPIYRALTEAIIYDSNIGNNDLEALDSLCEAILRSSADADDQDHVLSVLDDAWSQRASVNHLDWILGAIDMLIDSGLGEHPKATALLTTVVNSSRAWSRRVSDEQWSLLELLAQDLNLSELIHRLRPEADAISKEAKPDIRGRFAGKSIAIYSITERIAKRAQQLIQQAFDGVTIHLLHDKCCTDRMKALAQSVDVFLVNTWDAKHAATNGIRDNRKHGAISLQPKSKSPSAILHELTELESQNVT